MDGREAEVLFHRCTYIIFNFQQKSWFLLCTDNMFSKKPSLAAPSFLTTTLAKEASDRLVSNDIISYDLTYM